MTPRIMLAAASSASGKTTVTCAVLRALCNQGKRVAPYKCGPDFIDPMYLRAAAKSSRATNLDLFFSSEQHVAALLEKSARGADVALIEGVMGYYDGLAGTTETASSYDLARATGTPVILVVGCRGMSVSIAAQIKGFLSYRENSGIAGVILNNLPASLYPELSALILRECGIPCVGYLPPMPDCAFESRHLGLVTDTGAAWLEEILERLAAQARQSIDCDLLMQIAVTAPPLAGFDAAVEKPAQPVRIAVAQDDAFCFYYAETLELLRDLGAQTVSFSPLADAALPPDIGGLLLGGGYPELHAKQLSANSSMRDSVRNAVQAGLPTIAECGGFLYLHDSLEDEHGIPHPMAGVIHASAYKTARLGRFGYIELTAQCENLLGEAGQRLRAHEFHYWDSKLPGDAYTAVKPIRNTTWNCVHATKTLFAGFPHLYLAGNLPAAHRFVDAAAEYQRGKQH